MHALDLIRDLIALSRRYKELAGQIVPIHRGFHCHRAFAADFAALETRTCIPSRSLGKFSDEDLITLGVDFSFRPSVLDPAVSIWWESLHSASNIPRDLPAVAASPPMSLCVSS